MKKKDTPLRKKPTWKIYWCMKRQMQTVVVIEHHKKQEHKNKNTSRWWIHRRSSTWTIHQTRKVKKYVKKTWFDQWTIRSRPRRSTIGKRSADLVHQPMGAATVVSGVDPLVNVAIDATMENMKPSYS
jgi:hypothetical protein